MKHVLTRNENSNDSGDGLVAEFLDMLGDGEAGQCTAFFSIRLIQSVGFPAPGTHEAGTIASLSISQVST